MFCHFPISILDRIKFFFDNDGREMFDALFLCELLKEKIFFYTLAAKTEPCLTQ